MSTIWNVRKEYYNQFVNIPVQMCYAIDQYYEDVGADAIWYTNEFLCAIHPVSKMFYPYKFESQTNFEVGGAGGGSGKGQCPDPLGYADTRRYGEVIEFQYASDNDMDLAAKSIVDLRPNVLQEWLILRIRDEKYRLAPKVEAGGTINFYSEFTAWFVDLTTNFSKTLDKLAEIFNAGRKDIPDLSYYYPVEIQIEEVDEEMEKFERPAFAQTLKTYGETYEVEQGITPTWFGGQFPETVGYHMVFSAGHSFYIPDFMYIHPMSQLAANRLGYPWNTLLWLVGADGLASLVTAVIPKRNTVAYGKTYYYKEAEIPVNAHTWFTNNLAGTVNPGWLSGKLYVIKNRSEGERIASTLSYMSNSLRQALGLAEAGVSIS